MITTNSDIYNRGKKGRILFIGYYLFPLGGSHSIRLCNFINYLDEFGWAVDVLTIIPSPNFPTYDCSLTNKLRDSIKVFRTFPGPFNRAYCNMIQAKRMKSKSDLSLNSDIFNKRDFLEIFRSIASNVIIPDSNIEWYPFGVYQGLKLTKKYKYNLLISSALPATCHLIAYTIKKRRDLPWIVDYGDPWVFNPGLCSNTMKFHIEYLMEKNILESADAITVTTLETKQNYLKNYPFIEKKVTVIPMGADFEQFNELNIEKSEKFRIVYTGSIYEIRNLKPFLDAVELFNEKQRLRENIEILFAGSVDGNTMKLIEYKHLQGVIKLLGYLPYDKMPSLLLGADVLLFLGNKGGLQVPGKLFEYLAAKRPIFFIKGDENDPSFKILKDLNRGIIVDNKKEDIYLGLIRLYNLYRERILDRTFDNREILDISWKNRAKLLDSISEKLAR